jgi:uncharacterized membrane protein
MGMIVANTVCSYVFEKFFIGWYNQYYEEIQKSTKMEEYAQSVEKLEDQ